MLSQRTPNDDEQGVTRRPGDAPERGAASGCRRRRKGIQEPPGGALDRQSDDAMRGQPAAGEGLALGRQATEARHGFAAFEREFRLPAQAMRRRHLGRRRRGRQRGDQHRVARRPRGRRLRRPVRAAPALAPVPRLGGPRRRLRLEAEDEEARRGHGVAARPAALAGVVHRDGPLGHPAEREGAEDPLPRRRRPVRVQQAQPGPAGAHDEVRPRGQDPAQRRRAGVAAAAERHAARPPGGPVETPGAAPVGEPEVRGAAGDRVVGGVQSVATSACRRGR